MDYCRLSEERNTATTGIICTSILTRNFSAERPNQKWVTDISYIHTKQGVLYLSVIRDLYDNSIVAYKTGCLYKLGQFIF